MSIRTLDKRVSIQVKEICKAILWVALPMGYSASLNPKYRLVVVFEITSSN